MRFVFYLRTFQHQGRGTYPYRRDKVGIGKKYLLLGECFLIMRMCEILSVFSAKFSMSAMALS